MPVIGPNVNADEVNLWIRMYLTEEISIQLTSPNTFAACCNQVIGIKALDKAGLILYPLGKTCLGDRVAGKGTRLVGELPSQNSR